MIRAVIFDCFGVLSTEAWLPFKTKYFGHDPRLFAEASDIARQANMGLIDQADFVSQIAQLAVVEANEVSRAMTRNVPNEPLFAYLKQLKPKYKLGFLSNIAEDRLHSIFGAEHLALFDAITLSFKSGHVKPEVGAYQEAADQLGVDITECVLIDDQERNVSGARRAGMAAILYEDVTQLQRELTGLLTDAKS